MRVVALLISCSLLACTDEPVSVGEVASAVVSDNRLAGNTLSENRLAGNTLASNQLAGARLANGSLSLNATANDLLSTEGGREVLSFIISCALDETVTVVGEFGGDTFEFFGDLGLAQRWLNHPLDHKGKGWVSSCLFARVNASAIPVPISLRGPHKRLTADDDEKASWSLQEGAFYGNYFTDGDIDWNACRGSDQAAGETAGLISRDCTEPVGNTGLTVCGFKYAGDCGDFAAEHACKKFDDDGTFYQKCRGNAAFHNKKGDHHDDDDDHHGHGHDDDGDCHFGGHNHNRAYRQVITVYVLGS
jgi:hypothetical protein